VNGAGGNFNTIDPATLQYDYMSTNGQAGLSGSASGYRGLQWADGSTGNSSITMAGTTGTTQTIIPPAVGGPENNGSGVTLTTIDADVHKINNGHPVLQSGTALMTLSLTPDDGTGTTVTFATTLDFYYSVTANNPNSSDLFFVADVSAFDNTTFDYNGGTYLLDFTSTFTPLTGADLLNAQQILNTTSTDIYGWETVAGGEAVFPTTFTITYEGPATPETTAVPEPSTMLLFGVGLAGLGWYGRRRNGRA
jgi:hypothetical protein